jgi:hypothetical protein
MELIDEKNSISKNLVELSLYVAQVLLCRSRCRSTYVPSSPVQEGHKGDARSAPGVGVGGEGRVPGHCNRTV